MGLFRILFKWFGRPRYTLFISYSRKHKDFALKVYKLFTISHLPFLDQTNINPGDQWQSVIDDALQRCTHLLVLWCVHADESEYVRCEIDQALQDRKTIMIIVIGDHPLPPKLAPIQTLPDMFSEVCLGDPRATVDQDRSDTFAGVSNEVFHIAETALHSQYKGDMRSLAKRRAAALVAMLLLPATYSSYLVWEQANIGRVASTSSSGKIGETFKECMAGCPEMVAVPVGTFTMGSPDNESGRFTSEGPQHKVEIAYNFAVGRFAVTFDEWDLCVADADCSYAADDGWGRGRRPVINVSWEDAKKFTAWLSRKTGKNYRLLSEAEREYVTRAGTTTPFWTGESISTQQANFNGTNSGGEFRRQTIPVDTFRPNQFGLYQISGNVWEWTEDCWHGSYEGAPSNGSPWISDNCFRVLRGGSWFDLPGNLRSASRGWAGSTAKGFRAGFRVARTFN